MKSIWVVDDDADLLDMVSLVLSSHGLHVNCFRSGSELMERVQSNNPDLLLMDIYLGDSDGRELCHQLKTTDQYAHIPVILYSAGNIPAATIY